MKLFGYRVVTGVRKNSLLICFIGIDGSGKTRHAKKLVDWMRKQGVEAEYVWNGFEPLILKPFMKVGKALFFRGKDMFKDYTEYFNRKRRIFQNPLVSTICHYLLLFEYLVHTIFVIGFKLISNKSIVCDRYIYDMIVGMAVDMNYSDKKFKNLFRNSHLLPKPDLAFLIDLPEAIAYKRKSDIPSIDYLKKRRKIYLKIGKEYRMKILDGSKDLTELENQIQDKVKTLVTQLRIPTKQERG